MNTLGFLLACAVLVLIAISKLPGLEHLVRPTIDLLFKGLQAVIESSVSWSIWAAKAMLGAHIEVAKHLVLSEEALDPSAAVRDDV